MKGNHSYTRVDLDHRLKSIIGESVEAVDCAGVLKSPKAAKNKGRIGAVVEQSVLGYPADSEQGPDLDVDGEPWELKVTGLIESARGKHSWRAKEPMSITAVSPDTIVGESFRTSSFWHKAERLLVVYYLYVRPGKGAAVEFASFEFKGYDFHVWSEVDRSRLEADWSVVRDYVRDALEDREAKMPGLSTLVNPRLLYIDTSPKYPHPPRFRLKASLVTQVARERLDEKLEMISDDSELDSMAGLEAYLAKLSNLYGGQTLESIAESFGLPIEAKTGQENKALAEQVVVRIFTGTSGKISQIPLFAKAGLIFKTVTLTSRGGRTEDMKLNPSIDFEELCDPSIDFEDSAFAAPFIDSTLVVAVLSEQWDGCPIRACQFKGFKSLWLGSYLDDSKTLWSEMRELIFTHGLKDVPVLKRDGSPRLAPKSGVPMVAPNWPKSHDGVLFIRGTGANATDKPVSVNGVKMYRQNIWIKGKEIAARLGDIPFLSSS